MNTLSTEIERLNKFVDDGSVDSWTIRYHDYGKGLEFRCYIWNTNNRGHRYHNSGRHQNILEAIDTAINRAT